MASQTSQPRYAVIMAGGAGTRFWPLSRRTRPKHLLPIAGRRTMLQETAARLRGLIPASRIVVVTGYAYAKAVREQLPELPAANILVEPVGRNTAPCIAWAAEWIHRRAPNSTMVVLPADHAIGDVPAFRRALRRAFAVAERRHALVTLGITPTHPETGYGYIKAGANVGAAQPAAFRVTEFREKPNAARAKRFVASGKYLWNAGIFIWETAVIRAALQRHLPAVARAVARLGAGARRVTPTSYKRLPAVAIDVAVMEPAASEGPVPVVVITGQFGWNDVGSWAALRAVWPVDRRANAVRGRALLVDSAGVTVAGDSRLIALLGVRDLVVVDTPDALLICPASRSQDVRALVAELTQRGWDEFL